MYFSFDKMDLTALLFQTSFPAGLLMPSSVSFLATSTVTSRGEKLKALATAFIDTIIIP